MKRYRWSPDCMAAHKDGVYVRFEDAQRYGGSEYARGYANGSGDEGHYQREIARLKAKLESIRARSLNLAQWIDKGCEVKHAATEASFIALYAKEPPETQSAEHGGN